ncbi:MAG: sugar-binding domain-containing protein [Alphaproteobacteria bacterium]
MRPRSLSASVSGDTDTTGSRSGAISRRDLLSATTMAGAASLVGGLASAQAQPQTDTPLPRQRPGPEPGGLLYPQQNQFRNVMDLSGLWEFQLDPREEGQARGWFSALPAPRPIPVPCSWNDLFDDARNYLDLAWYLHRVWLPAGWRGQRVFLRVGSANYAARVWVNDVLVTEHQGGHLPFAADISGQLAWDRPNVIAISGGEQAAPGTRAAGARACGRRRGRRPGRFPGDHIRFLPLCGAAPAGVALLGPGRGAYR